MGAGMRLISGFSAFAPGSESSRSISSVFPGQDGEWGPERPPLEEKGGPLGQGEVRDTGMAPSCSHQSA